MTISCADMTHLWQAWGGLQSQVLWPWWKCHGTRPRQCAMNRATKFIEVWRSPNNLTSKVSKTGEKDAPGQERWNRGSQAKANIVCTIVLNGSLLGNNFRLSFSVSFACEFFSRIFFTATTCIVACVISFLHVCRGAKIVLQFLPMGSDDLCELVLPPALVQRCKGDMWKGAVLRSSRLRRIAWAARVFVQLCCFFDLGSQSRSHLNRISELKNLSNFARH